MLESTCPQLTSRQRQSKCLRQVSVIEPGQVLHGDVTTRPGFVEVKMSSILRFVQKDKSSWQKNRKTKRLCEFVEMISISLLENCVVVLKILNLRAIKRLTVSIGHIKPEANINLKSFESVHHKMNWKPFSIHSSQSQTFESFHSAHLISTSTFPSF